MGNGPMLDTNQSRYVFDMWIIPFFKFKACPVGPSSEMPTDDGSSWQSIPANEIVDVFCAKFPTHAINRKALIEHYGEQEFELLDYMWIAEKRSSA